MEINKAVVGYLKTNCYILIKNGKCLVIDPGSEYEKINKVISDNKVVGVIITHNHFDHISALKYFDKSLVYDKNNLEEKEYCIEEFKFKVIYTPGHKEDCITIYFEKEKVMFTGDFLFNGTIGRTDLPGSDYNDMLKSLEKMKKYDKSIKIFPGHGSSTVLIDEIDNY